MKIDKDRSSFSSMERHSKHGVQRNIVGDTQDPEVIQNPEMNSNKFSNSIGVKTWDRTQSRMQLARFRL